MLEDVVADHVRIVSGHLNDLEVKPEHAFVLRVDQLIALVREVDMTELPLCIVGLRRVIVDLSCQEAVVAE